MQRKKIIGLTGIYCSGKNFIAAILEQRGLPVLDVDRLGYLALEEKKDAVFARFGFDLKTTTVNADGSEVETINRRLLGKRVFGKPAEMAALELLIHPVVNRLSEEWISSQKGTCVVNAAVLHKSSIFNTLDFIIVVTAPFFTRLRRAHLRDKLSVPQLLRRFTSQKGFTTQYLSGKADIYKVENPGLPLKAGKKSTGIGTDNISSKLEHRIDEILSAEGIK